MNVELWPGWTRGAHPLAAGERLYTRYQFRSTSKSRCWTSAARHRTGGRHHRAEKIGAYAETYNLYMQPHTVTGPSRPPRQSTGRLPDELYHPGDRAQPPDDHL